jgi:hypothetical protein
MKLTDLSPEFRPVDGTPLAKQWALERGPNAPRYMGVEFTCPCGKHRLWIPFRRGGEPDDYGSKWEAQDESPATLTLSPSILDRGCGAHYWIRNGEVITC